MTPRDLATGGVRWRPPGVVVSASLLLVLSGLARIAQVVAEAAEQRTYLRAHEEVGTPGGWAAVPLVFLMAVALFVMFFAAALLALAVANLAGRNWTRVVTWAIGGVTLLVAGAGLVLSLLPADGRSQDMTDWDSVNAVAAKLMPGWVDPVSTLSGWLASPALLVAVVLLALPPANAFYRSRSHQTGFVYSPTAI